MYLLGAHLPDQKLVRIALTSFYGISHATARRLCARLQLHEAATVSSLNDSQVNSLSAYLSSPGSVAALKLAPTSPIIGQAGSSRDSSHPQTSQESSPSNDPLRSIVLESDLKRQIKANIVHHTTLGTYRGKRHLQGLPVRGQRTRTNANTAAKLNRIGRSMTTWARARDDIPTQSPSILSLIEPMRKLQFRR